MALIRCNQCGNMVSENAQACPHCGNPLQVGYAQPQQNYNQFNNMNANVAPKSKTTAGLLAIFLGAWGVHYFYLNKTAPGIVFLFIWLFFFFLWFIGARIFIFPILLEWLFCIIQGIIMLSMPDEQFNAKYVNTTNQFPLF